MHRKALGQIVYNKPQMLELRKRDNEKPNYPDFLITTFSETQLKNMIIQGFMVGAGNIGAHTMYAYWLALNLNITLPESFEFLRKSLSSLSESSQLDIIRAACKTHPERIREENIHIRHTRQKKGLPDEGFRERMITSITHQLPNNVCDIRNYQELAQDLGGVEFDREFLVSGEVVEKLKLVVAKHEGYDGKEWFSKLPDENPLKIARRTRKLPF